MKLIRKGQPLAAVFALLAWSGALPVAALPPARPSAEARRGSLDTNATASHKAYELMAIDGAGQRVDLVRSHASLSRTLPSSLRPREERGGKDGDALRWLMIGRGLDLPEEISVVSTDSDGRRIDSLESVKMRPALCPLGTASGASCRESLLIRATMDRLDRSHPRAAEPSLHAEVGGRLVVFSAGLEAASIRVGGPRRTRLGALERYRAQLRVRVLRAAPGAGVAVGSDVAGGLEVVRREVASANALWGQCGIQFGDLDELDVKVVDPPPAHLFSVGCGLGLPARGGSFAVRVGDKRYSWTTRSGETPEQVANAIAAELGRGGLQVALSPNPRESFAAHASTDVLVRSKSGRYVPLEILPTQAGETSLALCLGSVNLADGLRHFTDADAAAGTLEERTLLKALTDADPTTIDVLVVPYFVTVGRIGESFVDARGLGVRNAIIIDRAGVRAGARSFALAHELGHVLLQVAGHPDDFGSDLPTALMDADAADSTVFGPRRLSVTECERAILQSGPTAPLPLLERWPLEP